MPKLRSASALIGLTMLLGLGGCAHIATPTASESTPTQAPGPYLNMMLARYAEASIMFR